MSGSNCMAVNNRSRDIWRVNLQNKYSNKGERNRAFLFLLIKKLKERKKLITIVDLLKCYSKGTVILLDYLGESGRDQNLRKALNLRAL